MGELIDLADAIPGDWVADTLVMVGVAAAQDYMAGKRPRDRLRHLIIVSRLLERLIFQIEGVPKSRQHVI